MNTRVIVSAVHHDAAVWSRQARQRAIAAVVGSLVVLPLGARS
jgi:hypothetical protein